MTEGKVRLFLPEFMPQLRSTPEPWTFKRAHVNNFSESRSVGSWKDHDWPEWTSIARTTQITLAHFMLERDMDPPSNDDQYLVLAQDEDEEEKEDDGLNSYWSEDDGDWFFDEEDKDFLNQSVELRILFEEKGGMP